MGEISSLHPAKRIEIRAGTILVAGASRFLFADNAVLFASRDTIVPDGLFVSGSNCSAVEEYVLIGLHGVSQTQSQSQSQSPHKSGQSEHPKSFIERLFASLTKHFQKNRNRSSQSPQIGAIVPTHPSFGLNFPT